MGHRMADFRQLSRGEALERGEVHGPWLFK